MTISDLLIVIGSILLVAVVGLWNLSQIWKGLTFRDFLEELGFAKPKNKQP